MAMAMVALRLGRPSSRRPNNGLGTGSAPAPRAPTPISSVPVSPSRRAARLGSRGGASTGTGARAPSSSPATLPCSLASLPRRERRHPSHVAFAPVADIRNTGVVKSRGQPSVDAHEGQSSGDGRTRASVARLLMEQGPITATAVAAELSLSAPAVRRHLDALLADGEAEVRQAA